MISALLNTVQTTLLGSRGFLLTSLLPTVLFSIGSYFIDTDLHPKHAVWAAQFVEDKPGFAASCVLLLILVTAYMFSSVNTALRELLEGKPLRWWRHKNPFLRHQMKAAEDARRRFDEYQRSYWTLTRAKWIETLREARDEGSNKPPPGGPVSPDLKNLIGELTRSKDSSALLDYAKLKQAVEKLAPVLRTSSANQTNEEHSKALSDLHVELVQSIRYQIGRLQRDRTQAYWESAAFPDDVAPTRMGNIAGTIRYYAESRYGMLLDVFWTRLQKQIQKERKPSTCCKTPKSSWIFLCRLFG